MCIQITVNFAVGQVVIKLPAGSYSEFFSGEGCKVIPINEQACTDHMLLIEVFQISEEVQLHDTYLYCFLK